jgi:hypothetical protein
VLTLVIMAAADVSGCAALLAKYKQHIKGNRLKEAKQLLTQLKLQVVQFKSLPPLCAQTSTSQQELILARDMLEQSVLLAIRLQVWQLHRHETNHFSRSMCCDLCRLANGHWFVNVYKMFQS